MNAKLRQYDYLDLITLYLPQFLLLFPGCLAQSRYEIKRQAAAALTIQKNIRRWILRYSFLHSCSAVLVIQSSIRGYVIRQSFMRMKEHRAAMLIQVFLSFLFLTA